MRLFDRDGNEFDVADDVATMVPKKTREDDARALIAEVIAAAVAEQRITGRAIAHSTLFNAGTPEQPRVEQVLCNAQVTVAIDTGEPINPDAVANTIIARMKAHRFTKEDMSEQDQVVPKGGAETEGEA